MTSAAAVSMTAMGMLGLVLVQGCVRASDGSYELRKSTMLSRALNVSEPVEPSTAVSPPPYTKITSNEPPRQYRSRMPKVAVPAMTISQNPPFRRADPEKPLDCHNESSPTGRVRVVCL